MNKNFALLPIVLILSACGTSVQRQTVDVSAAEHALLATASSIENSLRLLAAAQANAPRPLIDVSSLVTEEGGLGGKATLDWSGPVEPLLVKISDLTNYQLRIIGNTPKIPVMVSVTKEKQVLAEILRDVGLQTGDRAALVVYPGTRVIELRYNAPI